VAHYGPRRRQSMEDFRVLQRTCPIVLCLSLLCPLVACQKGGRRGGPNLQVSDKLKQTIIEIQSSVDQTNVDYATSGKEKRDVGSRTYATSAEKDLLYMTRFFEQREGRWQSFDGRSRKPNKQFTVTYGNKRQYTYGLEENLLITPNKALPLSDKEYADIRRICFNEG